MTKNKTSHLGAHSFKRYHKINRLPQSMCNNRQVPQVLSFICYREKKYCNRNSADSVCNQFCKRSFPVFFTSLTKQQESDDCFCSLICICPIFILMLQEHLFGFLTFSIAIPFTMYDCETLESFFFYLFKKKKKKVVTIRAQH